MLKEVIACLSPAYVALGGLVLAFLIQVCIQVNYALKVKRAGGVHAPSMANNPITALPFLYELGKAQATNRLLEYTKVYWTYTTPECPNLVEINITGASRTFITQEPEHIKTILTGKFADYGKGPRFHRAWERFLGNSIFNTDHQPWQDSRNLIRPMFIKDRVSDLHLMEKWVQVMIDQIPASGQTFDLRDLFYRLTLDIITDFLLGGSVNSLQSPLSDFAQALTDVQRAQTMSTALMPIERFIPKGKRDRGIKVIEDFIQPFINHALSIPPAELEKVNKSEMSFTFLHALTAYTRDAKLIRDQIIAVLLAGRDTTAATLSWTYYQLSQHPDIYKKLRQEILNTIGPNKAPTYDDLKNMKYLNYTINETLRLYPAVPFNVRYALADTTLPGAPGQPDISVVEGDAIFYSAILMQRRLDLYPPPSPHFAHPEVFSPDRWEHWSPKPWTYIPFNGGPRICIGQNFALTEMAYAIARLLQKFDRVEYRGEWEKQTHKVEIVGTPGDGVPVALYEAEKS